MLNRLLLMGLSPFGCTGESRKSAHSPIPLDSPPSAQPPIPTTEPAISPPQRSQYTPPENVDRPQVSEDPRIKYFPRFFLEGEPLRESYPVSFECHEAESQCHFALGAKYYSFDLESLSGDQIALTLKADFSESLPPNSQITALTQVDEKTYALFDSHPEGMESLPANVGIAIQSKNEFLPTFYFPFSADNSPISCPKNLFIYQEPSNDYRQLWVSASNCNGSDNFREGNLFALDFNPDGTLKMATDSPLITTQFNPQDIAGWNTEDRAYLLVVNTGKTSHSSPGGATDQVVTNGGVDVIDPVSKRFVANIPLGSTAPNAITISREGALAFLGSQVEDGLPSLDLELLATKLQSAAPTGPMEFWPEVAMPPISLNWKEDGTDKAFFPEIVFDDLSSNLFVSSFNDGRVYPLIGDYKVLPEIGVAVDPEFFGMAIGNFPCAGEGSEYCGEIEMISSGLLAMTGHPAGLTFIPNSVLHR